MLFRVHAALEEIRRRQKQSGDLDTSSVTEGSSDLHADVEDSEDDCGWHTASEDSGDDEDFVDAEDVTQCDKLVTQSLPPDVTPNKDTHVSANGDLLESEKVSSCKSTALESENSIKSCKKSKKWLRVPKKVFKRKSKECKSLENSSSDDGSSKDILMQETSL